MQENLLIRDCNAIRAVDGGLFVSAGQGIDTAFVHDEIELIFVKHGTLHLLEEQNRCSVSENQTHIVWPGTPHGILLSEEDDFSFYWVVFVAESTNLGPSEGRFEIPKNVSLEQPERLLELFHRYLDDLRTERLTPQMGSHLVALMLCEIQMAATTAVATKGALGSLVDGVQVYISKHFHEPISTCTVAEDLNYNPDYLERVFRSVTNTSITEAIHRKRIKEARRQLIHEYRNISEIAYACGFSDSGYFRRVFKRHTDMTPTKFRSLYSQVHLAVSQFR